MRYILAAVSLVISLVLLGLGIGQRTIWAPPETIVSQLDQATDAQILVIPGATMNAHDGRQAVVIRGDGPISAVVGRDHDVAGWVGESAHAIAGIDAGDALTLDEQAGSTDALPQLAGSDMWIEEHLGDGEVRFSIDLPVGYSIAIAGEPGTAAPADVRVEWPFDAKTPLFGPLVTAGLVFLALALVLFLLALRSHRRKRGPQRRSHRDLSRAERRALARDARAGGASRAPLPAAAQGELEAADTGASDTGASDTGASDTSDAPTQGATQDGTAADAPAADASTDRSRGTAERTARPARRLGLLAMPVVAVVALTGCGPQYWPGDPTTPAATEAPTPTSLEDTLPPVAITENQFERVLEDTRTAVAEADEALDGTRAASRVQAPLLDARATNYRVRSANPELAPMIGVPDGEVQLLLPQQTEVWPRTVMAVVGWQDPARAQAALVFQQADPRADYRLMYQTTLASGVQLPAVASTTIGAASLPGNTPLLQRQPDQITAAYADVLVSGSNSEYAAWFEEEGDALREALGRPAKDEMRNLPEFELSNLEWTAAEDDAPPQLLVTNDGGALLATSFTETQRATPREEGVEISAADATGLLAGVEQSTTGIDATYQIQVLFAVPPADAPEDARIRVVGFSQALLDAREVG